MFDHVGIVSSDFARSKAFYTAALAPLGFVLIVDGRDDATGIHHAGFGFPGKPQFWIRSGGAATTPLHIAFPADDRGAVSAFHAAALAAGGRDHGSPALRPHYHANYYAAFVHDPDGHNIEAVCHFPGRFQDQFTRDPQES